MKRTLWLAPLILACAGCTSLAPGAEKVKITTAAKDVEGCKILGQVTAPGPFNGPDDWKNQLKNATFALGGDAVFRTGPLAFTRHVDGIAYRCVEPSK
jgi:hypothetical protein